MNIYQIIVSMSQEQVIFETAANAREVDHIIDRYMDNNPECITVYTLNEGNDYRIAYRINKKPAPTSARMVGFGRW